MNTNSETTWMAAANKGFKKPSAASTIPRVSTPIVPAASWPLGGLTKGVCRREATGIA
jgi:hypothetical protein